MLVTTAGRTNNEMMLLAQKVAQELGVSYLPRKKKSIQEIHMQENSNVLVVGKNRFEFFTMQDDSPIFFHPNSAMFRIKRLIKHEHDPFVDACQLSEGMTFLDCTLGLGSDSIVASYVVGNSGQVVSIEANQMIYYLVKSGLKAWETEIKEMERAMRRIKVIHTSYFDFLKTCPSKTFDVVYFDPMFEEEVGSDGMLGIKRLANYDDVTESIITEAKRVAKKRIVLKDHWRSKRFERLGFVQLRRKTASFHYGLLEIE